MADGLTTVLPDLSARINHADAGRSAGRPVVVEYGLSQISVRADGLDVALAALRASRYGDGAVQQPIQDAADEVDARYFDAQDAGDEATASQLFKQARILTAVADALGGDAREAAQAAAYEVQATQNDLTNVARVIEAALGS